jgi:predicted DNA-binding antitoxin AbrB/MazE fold protein
MDSIAAIVRNGKIELLEPIDLPEGTQLTIAIEYNPAAEEWTQAEWTTLSLQGLSRAYGDDEPDYENSESKEFKSV